MIEEALRYLIELGQKSKPDVVRVEGEPPHVYYLRNPDGTLQKSESWAVDNHTVDNLESLVALVVANGGDVWVHSNGVVARIGERGRVTMPLVMSEQYKVLSNFKAGVGVSQSTLVLSLRTIFRDSPGVPELVSILRRVKFANGQIVTSEVGHGKASVGKEIMGEVTGAAAIPEYATFVIPVFVNPPFRSLRASVECAIEPDPANGNFRVILLPGEMDNAIEWALGEVRSQIVSLLGESKIAVYMGRP